MDPFATPLALGSRSAEHAHRDMRAVLLVRAVLAVMGGAAAIVAAVALAKSGIVDHAYPGFVAGASETIIASYSGPHLMGAIGLGAVGGLLLVSTVTDLWRRALLGRSLAECRPSLGH